MTDRFTTGLIDVGDIDLEDLKGLDIPALSRAWERLSEGSDIVASFQSAV